MRRVKPVEAALPPPRRQRSETEGQQSGCGWLGYHIPSEVSEYA